MSCSVNLQELPAAVYGSVVTAENMRGRSSINSLTSLSFPKSRSALWDGSPAGEKLCLQLCSHRKPRLVLLEKALRLAQRHARHSNKPRLHCFFLGSVSVDADEEGVTVILDRFDPGREQAGAAGGRVPSALLPGDVLVPCLFSTQTETSADSVVQSEAELHHCFKALQQFVSSRQTLDLSQLIKVRGRVVCSQQSDAAAFSLSWSSVCPSVCVDVQPVRAVPVIPTALLRSLTSTNRPLLHAANRQRGFLTMDQSRKLVLLLESDPKVSNLPLVGLWLSGVTHVYNPQVWAWCLRFLFSSVLQDRVLSERRCFLLVLFASTHTTPQFYQCRGPGPAPGPGPGPAPGPGPRLDYQLLTASQCVTLYQVVSVEGQTLRCELGSEDHSRQTEVFREAQTSFSSAPPPAGLSVSDQDSGVEDEDLSPRPSPSPHAPAQQVRRVQPSVPELSLLMDGSFTSTHRPPPPPPAAGNSSSSIPRPPPLSPPPHLHSTPNSNLQQPCTCCSTHTYDCTSIFSSPRLRPPPPAHSDHHTPPLSSNHPAAPFAPPSSTRGAPLSSRHHTPPPLSKHPPPPSAPPPSHGPSSTPSSHHPTPPPSTRVSPPAPPPCPCSHPPVVPFCGDSPSPPSWLPRPSCCDQVGGVVPTDAYQLLLHQDRQLRLLQAQVQMLLEAQRKLQVDTETPRSTASIAVGTGASLFWGDSVQPLPHQEVQAPPPSSPSPSPSTPTRPASYSPSPSSSCRPQSHADLSIIKPVGGAEDGDITGQEAGEHSGLQGPGLQGLQGPGLQGLQGPGLQGLQSPGLQSPGLQGLQSPGLQSSGLQSPGLQGLQSPGLQGLQGPGLQSPVLGESVSMYAAADEQQEFYHDLMNQLTSRLQESHCRQEVEEEEETRRRSLSVVADRSPSSHSSRRRQQTGGDSVVSATLRQLQQLGVDVDEDNLSETDRRIHQTVESSSTLASINPAAVVSRLSVSEPTLSSLFPGYSVDLSLEANAIALRYLSDSQLSRLSLGDHAPRPAPRPAPASSNDSLLSPSNMSLATRKYMRRYGLIEEEEEEEEVDVRQPLTEAQNVKLLPQSQLIRDLRPKMQLLAEKENCSSRRPSLVRASSRQTEGSVGNILDLSRLRQLPKLF